MKTGLSHGRNDKIPISSIEKAFFKIELRRWDKNMVQVRHEMGQVRHDMVQVRHEMAQVRHEMAQVRFFRADLRH